MQLDNIRVSRKLWGAFLGLMIGMLLLSSFAQNRGNNSMAAAMDGILEIEERISSAVRWRGATETAVTMVMGGAVTTDAVLAEQYGAKVKEIIGNINKVQEKIVASATAPEEKAALDKVLEARKAVLAATAKTWELKGAGDAVATQRYADDEFAPWSPSTSSPRTTLWPRWKSAATPSAPMPRVAALRTPSRGSSFPWCCWPWAFSWPGAWCIPSPCRWTRPSKPSTRLPLGI